MEEMYRDYGPEYINVPGFRFGCFYTPFGIRQKDHEFCKRILGLKKNPGEFDDIPYYLRQEIRRCYHLHPTIRRNLLQNFRRVVRERGLSTKKPRRKKVDFL